MLADGGRVETTAPLPARIVSALFGYDFFVSYAHADGTAYPAALAAASHAEPYRYTVLLDTAT